ncbi:MAG: CotH kinase family protein, partial [Saprospiraceae bacterium]|nr:CotH kinase family protein [Saprospiraceae bacterium]
KYKYLVLRNSGSDWGMSHFRDALMTGLVKNWDLDVQAYQPSRVYINGKYWGIYNLREKINSHYFQSHYGIDRDSIDILEHRYTVRKGSTKYYNKLLNFLETHDLADAQNYKQVTAMMDVDNFMRHQIAQIYCDNQDAGGNIRYWRPRREGAKWRWVLFDTDYGFGLHDKNAYKNNSLAFHTYADGDNWPNPAWSTFLLRKLLMNKEFKEKFVARFCDYLNTDLLPTHVNNKVDEIVATLAPEMPLHCKRWDISLKTWNNQIANIRNFANQRPTYIRQYMKEYFALQDEINLTFNCDENGILRINDNIEVKNDSLKGIYFSNNPIEIEAIAKFGYKFVGWKGIDGIQNRQSMKISFYPKEINNTIQPIFEKYDHPLANKLIINEICYYNPNSGDWVELFNKSDQAIDLYQWKITDGNNIFTIQEHITIKSDSFFILTNDIQNFKKVHPSLNNISHCDLRFDKKHEEISLIAPDNGIVDNVSYSVEPSDNISTISLLSPYLNNSYQDNWEILKGNGSPSRANPFYLKSQIIISQKRWTRIGLLTGVTLILLTLIFYKKKVKFFLNVF